MKPGEVFLGLVCFVVLAKFIGLDHMAVDAYQSVMQNLSSWF